MQHLSEKTQFPGFLFPMYAEHYLSLSEVGKYKESFYYSLSQ